MSGFFRPCKEYTTEHWKFCSQLKECASELCGVRKNVQGVQTIGIDRLKGSLRVIEYSGEGTVQREGIEKKHNY
jgi:hypothetical protein